MHVAACRPEIAPTRQAGPASLHTLPQTSSHAPPSLASSAFPPTPHSGEVSDAGRLIKLVNSLPEVNRKANKEVYPSSWGFHEFVDSEANAASAFFPVLVTAPKLCSDPQVVGHMFATSGRGALCASCRLEPGHKGDGDGYSGVRLPAEGREAAALLANGLARAVVNVKGSRCLRGVSGERNSPWSAVE